MIKTRVHNDYYEATAQLNSLLIEYFAVVDLDFWFTKRKKVKVLYDIHSQLGKAKPIVSNAIIRMCMYRAKIVKDGERKYPFDEFKRDIADFISMLDNFAGSGKQMGPWVEEKEQEYWDIVFAKKEGRYLQ